MAKKTRTICILLLAIGTIAFLPCLTFQKEKQTFTESNEILAVFLGEEKSKTFPAKEDGYVYNRTECTNDEVATWNAGTWKLTVSNITKETKCNVYFVLPFTEKEFAYKNDVEEFSIPVSGKYKLEVWGAQGGGSGIVVDGLGGYSVGTIFLDAGTSLYVYVGGQGSNSSVGGEIIPGGFNGGGSAIGSNASTFSISGNSGGGATHIALGSGVLKDLTTDAQKEKILIVAGGGGGGGGYGTTKYVAGAGGGTAGGDATGFGTYGPGKGGTQSAGGTGHSGSNNQGMTFSASGFGYGGSITAATSHSSGYVGAGGGGGYYGGGAGGAISAAGGGSGYIKTTLENAKTLAGNELVPTYDGLRTMTGNSGDGFAKITLVQ